MISHLEFDQVDNIEFRANFYFLFTFQGYKILRNKQFSGAA